MKKKETGILAENDRGRSSETAFGFQTTFDQGREAGFKDLPDGSNLRRFMRPLGQGGFLFAKSEQTLPIAFFKHQLHAALQLQNQRGRRIDFNEVDMVLHEFGNGGIQIKLVRMPEKPRIQAQPTPAVQRGAGLEVRPDLSQAVV